MMKCGSYIGLRQTITAYKHRTMWPTTCRVHPETCHCFFVPKKFHSSSTWLFLCSAPGPTAALLVACMNRLVRVGRWTLSRGRYSLRTQEYIRAALPVFIVQHSIRGLMIYLVLPYTTQYCVPGTKAKDGSRYVLLSMNETTASSSKQYCRSEPQHMVRSESDELEPESQLRSSCTL